MYIGSNLWLFVYVMVVRQCYLSCLDAIHSTLTVCENFIKSHAHYTNRLISSLQLWDTCTLQNYISRSRELSVCLSLCWHISTCSSAVADEPARRAALRHTAKF